jgi:hypothetical protein
MQNNTIEIPKSILTKYLTAPGLEQRLMDRLPALLAEFKAAVESLGFTF